jgi:hypothetical protein
VAHFAGLQAAHKIRMDPFTEMRLALGPAAQLEGRARRVD